MLKRWRQREQLGTDSFLVFANNVVYTSYSAEVNYYVKKRFGISASFASAFRGELIAAAPSYNVGVFLDTSK